MDANLPVYAAHIKPAPHPHSTRAIGQANAWECYERHLQRSPRIMEDRDCYIPSPDEIEHRMAMMLWLRKCGFVEAFITSIMTHNTPSFQRVVQMVDRHGTAETWRRWRPFIHI